MKLLMVAVTMTATLAVGPVTTAQTKYDIHARGIITKALTLPNRLGVSGSEFRTKPNPKGQGVFVYD